MKPASFLATGCAAIVVSATSTLAQSQSTWKQGLQAPGPVGTPASPQATADVRAAVAWDPDGPGPRTEVLVFGGYFVIPSIGARNLAWFDPATQQFGTFVEEPDNMVYALAVAADGSLLVGGAFTAVGATTTGRLARWNGLAWSAVGGGVSGPSAVVRVLQVMPNGDLIVGGAFTLAGSLATSGLARWDGTQWHSLAGASFAVSGFALRPNGTLAVTGNFPGSIAEWNGTLWTAYGPGIPFADRVVALPNGNLLANGGLLGLMEWNGTAWISAAPVLTGTPTTSLRLPNGDVLIAPVADVNGVPVNGVARFDGVQWQAYAANGGGNFLCAMANGDLYSRADPTAGEPIRAIGRWDGAQWRALARGFDNPVDGLLSMPSGEVMAFGRFRCAEGVATNYMARLSGQAFSPVVGPSFYYGQPQPTCGTIDQQGRAWVAGYVNSIPGPPAVHRWTGSGWSAVGGAIGSPVALAVDAGGSPIVGCATYTGGHAVARWNGTVWATYGAGLDGPVRAVLVRSNGAVVAGGEFLFSGTTAVSRIAQWNGTGWQPLGPGLDGTVRVLLELPNGDLIAGGDFANDGTLLRPLGYVARFDGTTWQPIGEGLAGAPDASVKALLVLPDGDLVVGGEFQFAGGWLARNIAQWNGARWSEVDGGVDGVVTALAQRPDGEILAGGAFGRAGGRSSAYFARLRTNRPALTAAYGSGCAGGAGMVSLQALNLPWVGSTYRARCSGVAANAIGVEVLGLSVLQQPLASVHPFAGGNCSLLASPDLLQVWLSTAGTIDAALPLPHDPVLVGATLYQQMLVAEPNTALTITRVVSSNGIELRIGSL